MIVSVAFIVGAYACYCIYRPSTRLRCRRKPGVNSDISIAHHLLFPLHSTCIQLHYCFPCSCYNMTGEHKYNHPTNLQVRISPTDIRGCLATASLRLHCCGTHAPTVLLRYTAMLSGALTTHLHCCMYYRYSLVTFLWSACASHTFATHYRAV